MANGLTQGNDGRSKYIPGYRRIEQDLRSRIRSGYWQPGALLPSRRELAQEYNVDVNTLQRAVTPLLQDGTLCANGSRGTFVADSAAIGLTTVTPPANLATASARLGYRTSVGIVAAADPDSPWVKAIVQAAEGTLADDGAKSLYFDIRGLGDTADDPPAALRNAALSLLAEGAEALLVVGIYDTPGLTEAMVSLLTLAAVPVVFISWHDTRRPLHQVFYDSQYAGYQAAEHLLRKGWKRILFLEAFGGDWVSERIETGRIAVGDAGLSDSIFTVFPGDAADAPAHPEAHTELGFTAFQQALDAGVALDGCGVIAPNDRAAYGVIEAARERNLAVGRDFGLIGFDDDPGARSLGLTTLRPPLEALGAEGVKLVLRAVNGERNPIQIRLHSRVIARAST